MTKKFFSLFFFFFLLTACDSNESETTTLPIENSNIVLNNNSISYSGDSAIVNGTTITITAGGEYHVSGVLIDGQIIIDLTKDEAVTLYFDGVTIYSKKNAPIYNKSSDEFTIVLKENTTNTLGDALSYTGTVDNEPNACLFSKDDLTISGEGILNVTGRFNNGIGTKDDLKIKGGTINVSAANNAFKGNEKISIKNAIINVTQCDTVFKTDDLVDGTKGNILIESGIFQLSSKKHTFHSINNLEILSGNFTIVTNGGYSNRENGIIDAYKTFYAQNCIYVDGGTYNIDSADNCFNAEKNLTINSGNFEINSGNNSVLAKLNITINGGRINTKSANDGLKANTIEINNGVICIEALGDGISNFNDINNDIQDISINGGELYIKANDDGIMANKTINLAADKIIVDANNAFSCEGAFNVLGGLLIAFSTIETDIPANTSSTQKTIILQNINSSENEIISIYEDYNEFKSFSLPRSFDCLVFSSQHFDNEKTYTVYRGGTHSGEKQDDYIYINGAYSLGTEVYTFGFSSSIVSHNFD